MRSKILLIAILAALGAATLSGTAAAATNISVINNGFTAYTVDGVDNATKTLTRGETYNFNVVSVNGNHPFYIVTARGAGGVSTNQVPGATNQGTANGTVSYTVPASGPAKIFYQCGFHDNMGGELDIVAPAAAVPSMGPAMLAVLIALFLLVAVAAMRRIRPRSTMPL
jgi:hypothetical protein